MTGFIIFDKPEGITSFIGARIIRRVTNEKKTGHTGTLDPMATGVLPVALGNATRFIELLPCHDKGYRASFRLGETTDTLDITGKTLTTSDNIPDEQDVLAVFKHFRGEIEQLPPMYSAIQIDGKRLYDLARQGIEVEREKRKVTIYSLEHISHNGKEYTIDVKCSKGTYIRSLIADIGEMLGCGAVMTSLRRTLSNGFSIEDAHTEQELKSAADASVFVIPVDKALEAYSALYITDAQAKRFKNGGELDAERLKKKLTEGLYRVYSPEGKFLGLGEYKTNELSLKVKRVFVDD
ncbi:MAG: tRNA pseudouridine(55) synthase TruB [Clostridia bacterium]|nr:tRNA pseudouridine(55) synthase TruB [Clostridia bacterium]